MLRAFLAHLALGLDIFQHVVQVVVRQLNHSVDGHDICGVVKLDCLAKLVNVLGLDSRRVE
jgi:hypothetical protein